MARSPSQPSWMTRGCRGPPRAVRSDEGTAAGALPGRQVLSDRDVRRRDSVWHVFGMARASVRGVERDLRHAACAHAGARQAGGGACAARAAAPARGAAAHRARLGDASAARARRLGRARRRARSAPHEAVVEHSDGRVRRVALAPDRPVGEVTRELLAAARGLVGTVEIDPTPQEVPWTTPLDEDDEHATYDPAQVDATSPRRRGPRSCSPSSARPTADARRR